MKGSKSIRGSTEWEKEFLTVFNYLCKSRRSWEVWQDFVTMSACAIANAVDWRNDVWKKREGKYMAIVKNYTKDETNHISELLGIVTMALDENPDQDFLGSLYMRLNLGNHWQGQFFTPWHVSELMARMTLDESVKERIEADGYISVGDQCCGAGGMLIAFASACRNKDIDINYQQSVLFVGQDVDPVVAQMCYIQISLLGCAGYVIVGDSIVKPPNGTLFEPIYDQPENIWYTPLYFSNTWFIKRLKARRNTKLERDGEQIYEVSKPDIGKSDCSIVSNKTQNKKESVKMLKEKKFSWKEFFTVKKRK